MRGNTGILTFFKVGEQPMRIEQRQSLRRNGPVDICLQVDRREIASKIRDLGMNGAFMELEHLNVKPATAVRARLSLSYHGDLRDCYLPAEFVHVSHDGVAIKFHNYDNWSYTALVDFSYARQ
jgi:hypothetical protein